MVVMVFILQYLFGFENLAASRDIFPRNVALLGNEGAVMTTALLNALFRAMTKDEVRKVSNFDQTAAFESWSTRFRAASISESVSATHPPARPTILSSARPAMAGSIVAISAKCSSTKGPLPHPAQDQPQ
jgi:hypothetical protein